MKKYQCNEKVFDNLSEVRDELGVMFSDEISEKLLAKLGVEVVEEKEEQTEEMRLALAKQIRANEVSNITIDVDGMIFDGDEVSQGRMRNAIEAMKVSGKEEIEWKLADEKVALVTLEQLESAFVQAVETMNALWVDPYK